MLNNNQRIRILLWRRIGDAMHTAFRACLSVYVCVCIHVPNEHKSNNERSPVRAVCVCEIAVCGRVQPQTTTRTNRNSIAASCVQCWMRSHARGPQLRVLCTRGTRRLHACMSHTCNEKSVADVVDTITCAGRDWHTCMCTFIGTLAHASWRKCEIVRVSDIKCARARCFRLFFT